MTRFTELTSDSRALLHRIIKSGGKVTERTGMQGRVIVDGKGERIAGEARGHKEFTTVEKELQILRRDGLLTHPTINMASAEGTSDVTASGYEAGEGQQLHTRAHGNEHGKANWLPRQQLHPRIGEKTAAAFLRGDYDTAVFQAFKEVEVSVREAGGYNNTDIGVSLMRKAFRRAGPLADAESPEAEGEALAHLFAGAIGSYKNPSSHRNVTIDAAKAAEIIVLASHLLGIVDERSPTGTTE